MNHLLVAGAVAAMLVGSGTGWMARGIVVDTIEIPRIVTEQAELCVAATEKAAADAVAAEQLRQFRIGERATQQFYEASQLAAEDEQARRDLLELEIEAYAQRVRDRGGFCSIDTDALDLLGLQLDGQSHQPGGR